MSADNQDTREALGFSFRRLVLLVFILIASRGAIELISSENRLAGVGVVILVGLIAGWLVLRYEASHSEE
ncbi:hypothetical protein ACOZ4I_03985 [Haloarcula salina]|uniref:hypothetical protein n=1 Tax=Haloarcula salina TaxID=1429914 RepID=UPI003C702F45